METGYPTSISIVYSNDQEYRSCIRKLSMMKLSNINVYDTIDTIDPITLDECDYDEEAINRLLDYVYSQTSNEKLFQELYKCAAAVMISENPSIGLAVLFSYNYFDKFHNCLVQYFSLDLCWKDSIQSLIVFFTK
jgi:hypothetical protein